MHNPSKKSINVPLWRVPEMRTGRRRAAAMFHLLTAPRPSGCRHGTGRDRGLPAAPPGPREKTSPQPLTPPAAGSHARRKVMVGP